jgi:hypothetical protein
VYVLGNKLIVFDASKEQLVPSRDATGTKEYIFSTPVHLGCWKMSVLGPDDVVLSKPPERH